MPNPNIGELVTTTLRRRRGEIADNVSNSNALLATMKRKGGIEVVGGRTLSFPLEYGEQTFTRYSGFDTLPVSAVDILDSAEYDDVSAAVSVALSGPELRRNRGKEQVIPLIKARIRGAMKSMANNISTDIYSDGAESNQIGGLQLIVSDTSGDTVGGISSTTYSWWDNSRTDISATAAVPGSAASAGNIQDAFNDIWIKTYRGNDRTNLITVDANYWTYYQSSLQQLMRFTDPDVGELGFPTLKYMTADVIYDGDSGHPTNHAYFLNTDFLKFASFQGANFDPSEERVSFNQDAVVQYILWQGNLCCSNRARQGVVFN